MKSGRKTLVLLAVLVVCVASYFIVPKGNSSGSEDDTAQTQSDAATEKVVTIQASDVKKVQVYKGDTLQYGLIKSGKKWKFDEKKSKTVDQDTVTKLLENVSDVTAARSLDFSKDNLKEYGLESPALKIVIRTKDKTYEFYLGDTVPVSGGYYGYTQDQNKIYCFGEELYTAFAVEKKSFVKS